MATLVKQGTIVSHPGVLTEIPIEEKATLGHVPYLPPSIYITDTPVQVDCYGAGPGTFDGGNALAGIHATIGRRRLGAGTRIGTFLEIANTTSATVTVAWAVYRG